MEEDVLTLDGSNELLNTADGDAPENNPLLNKKYLNKKDYISFSMARFASSAMSGLIQGYLLFYYTVCMGIPATSVGTMFLIAKIFDGLNDPIMGVIVDKTRSRWGKMRPYLIFGSIPAGIILIMLFIPIQNMAVGQKIAYMYVTYILSGLIGTIVGVPLDGIPAVCTPNTNERTKIISVSRIVGSIGEQSALVLISFGLLFSEDYATVYLIVAIVIGVLGSVFQVFAGFTVKERLEPTEERPKIMDGFAYLFKNKPFLLLILSNLLTFFRNLVSASILYVVTYIYANGSLQIIFALPGAVASMLGMLLAPKLKQKMDAKQLFIFSTIWHSVALALVYIVYVAGGNSWPVIAVMMFLAMMPVGILNVVPHLMATDTLDYWEDKTGQRAEGVTFSLMGLRSKVSSGLKDYFMSWLLVVICFSQPLSFLSSHKPQQSDLTQVGIILMYTLIPAVLNMVSIIPMLFYPLSGKRCAEIQLRLLEKRKLDAEKLEENAESPETSAEPVDTEERVEEAEVETEYSSIIEQPTESQEETADGNEEDAQ